MSDPSASEVLNFKLACLGAFNDREIADSRLAVPGESRSRRALPESYGQRLCRRTAQPAASFRDGKPLP